MDELKILTEARKAADRYAKVGDTGAESAMLLAIHQLDMFLRDLRSSEDLRQIQPHALLDPLTDDLCLPDQGQMLSGPGIVVVLGPTSSDENNPSQRQWHCTRCGQMHPLGTVHT